MVMMVIVSGVTVMMAEMTTVKRMAGARVAMLTETEVVAVTILEIAFLVITVVVTVLVVIVMVMEREKEIRFISGPNRMSHTLECTAALSQRITFLLKFIGIGVREKERNKSQKTTFGNPSPPTHPLPC